MGEFVFEENIEGIRKEFENLQRKHNKRKEKAEELAGKEEQEYKQAMREWRRRPFFKKIKDWLLKKTVLP